MANKFLKVNQGWQDVETLFGITLSSNTTYTIGADEIIRIYDKATTPGADEGYLVKNNNVAYTHTDTSKKLWVKALIDTNVTI